MTKITRKQLKEMILEEARILREGTPDPWATRQAISSLLREYADIVDDMYFSEDSVAEDPKTYGKVQIKMSHIEAKAKKFIADANKIMKDINTLVYGK